MARYEKPTDSWSEIPLRNEETGEIIPPVGFCEFCDKNNDVWFTPNMRCHNKET